MALHLRGGATSGVSVSSIDEAHLWFPKGYFAPWDAALAAAGSALAEVAIIGDSTTFGQTTSGGSTYNANNYSFVDKLRRLSIATGYADGGVGFRGYQDSASLNTPDGVDAILQTNRADVGCGTTSASNVVTDAAILATDIGRPVSFSAGFGASGFVGAVTAGVSFTVVTTKGGSTALNATSSTTATATLTGDGWTGNDFQGLQTYDPVPANFTQTGYVTVLQGKAAICRLNYMQNTAFGSFTYSINGGGATTVVCAGTPNKALFVNLANPSPGSLCQITLTYTATGTISVWPEWINANGIVYHKDGIPGNLLSSRVPSRGTSIALGRCYDAVWASANGGLTNVPNTSPRRVKLAVLWMGINDMAASTTQANAFNFAQLCETSIGIFAQHCLDGGFPGVVMCPEFWAFTNAVSYAPLFKRVLAAACKAYGVAWLDIGALALEPVSAFATNGLTFGSGPHCNATGYDAVATTLWNTLLNPATAVR